MSQTVIEIKQLVKSFDHNEVLKGINLEIKQGQIISIIGSSGSGKSTLLRCLNTLEPYQSGTILINNKDLKTYQATQLHQLVGIVFQSFNLFNHLSVLDNCCIAPIKVLKEEPKQVKERALALLKRVGMEDFAQAMPSTLSGG
ncbi:MAG: ATP-binding cassette domain-containing protein, partial [Bacilli bacterium]